MYFRRFAAASLVMSLGLATAAQAATPVEVVQRHVDNMKRGAIQPIMDDYSADTVVVTPQGLVPGQTPAKGPGVYSGQTEARRVFTQITKGDNAGIKAMESTIEPAGTDGAIMHWIQFRGQPNQVSGKDVFIVRNDKIVFQAILVD